LDHELTVHLLGDGGSQAAFARSLAAAGLRVADAAAPADASLLVSLKGSDVAAAVAAAAASNPVETPLVLVGLERDAERTREAWRAGADEVLFADELDRLPQLVAELHERGRRSPELGEDETIHALILALDTREQETAGHSHRVALWTLLLALACEVPEPRLRAIHRGALLHDLGKIGIPDSILLKTGELTPQEWEVMRTHPQIGRDLVRRIARLRGAAEIPWAHHERYDGSGYPRGLKGEQIPLGARLFGIVDVYDALRSARSYKRACSHSDAIAFVGEASGKHFDPQICARFVALPEQAWSELATPDVESRSYPQLLALAREVLAKVSGAAPAAL
jgi:HD-GYP domain-containing protein (c-di-GMP phosphodiesterase class II)